MEKEIKVKFYCTTENIDRFAECVIYNKAGCILGCNGDIKTIHLSDGNIIQTNDLWIINFFLKKENLPKNALFGEILYDINKKVPDNFHIDKKYIYEKEYYKPNYSIKKKKKSIKL